MVADRLQASCLNFIHKLDDHVHMKNVDGPHVAASWTLIIKHTFFYIIIKLLNNKTQIINSYLRVTGAVRWGAVFATEI